MKTIKIIILFFFSSVSVLAQKEKNQKTTLYAYNEKWEQCPFEEAKYFGCFDELSDTTYRWRYYNYKGPLIAIETYKDKEGKIPHGYFAFFDANGHIDSSGYSSNGLKDNWWYYFTDSLTLYQSEGYDKGILVQRKDEIALRKERNKLDTSSFQIAEKEATFKGGEKAWRKYLENNLKFPDRAGRLNKSGLVLASFVIGTDGLTKDISIFKSVEFSLDEEAVRLIITSPRWNPAIQNGRPVNVFRRQPITFALQ